MEYVVGSVAALVSGNVTPNRPKLLRRALTPTKHQPSPNVTPKSEMVEDRSIFLSPTQQKKKAIVKKSPKRIFQNPEEDLANDGEGTQNTKSPKADKVKKHLKDDLDGNVDSVSPKSPKNKNLKVKESSNIVEESVGISMNTQIQNKNTPKKKKKNSIVVSENLEDHNIPVSNESKTSHEDNIISNDKGNLVNPSPKKVKKQKTKLDNASNEKSKNEKENVSSQVMNVQTSPKKKNKLKNLQNLNVPDEKGTTKKNKSKTKSVNDEYSQNEGNDNINDNEDMKIEQIINKKKRKRKNKKDSGINNENTEENSDQETEIKENKDTSKKKKNHTFVNPNAITEKDTDSEHDSDNDIESENEQNNKEVLDTGPAEESSDEEAKEKVPEKKEVVKKINEPLLNTEEEIKRTLFVGNVPFSAKCKKEIKKIFSKYGQIDTVRIRTVPVKDGRVTPKLAVIKNELHPDRSTVNVYVKFRDPSSVNEALAENGTVLNDHHLRVTRSDCTGSEHDPKCSVFIGNLPFAMEDEALQQKFQQCGEIDSVRIIRDKKTNAGKGFGYVNFKSKDAVELALALSEEELTVKNRILRVKRCSQATHKQKQQDNRGAQRSFSRGIQRNYGRGNTQRDYSRGGAQGNFGRGNNQGNYRGGNVQGRNQFGNRDDRQVGRGNFNDSKADGAMRRLMNKRKTQDGVEGPPNKVQRIHQPGKKPRKEFVGITAEKKKKNKFNKGQKKRKALSEILTK
ncbi:uncharacterized protein [Battus philenor]|uniref:uncharacterized protein n=1 Tax=Battus philenor TaxID=42288 RepID=UPI0035D04F55